MSDLDEILSDLESLLPEKLGPSRNRKNKRVFNGANQILCFRCKIWLNENEYSKVKKLKPSGAVTYQPLTNCKACARKLAKQYAAKKRNPTPKKAGET